MAEEPKKILIEIVGRLGRETQLHLDEGHHHFRITNLVIWAISALLVVVAVFNIYFVSVLYQDLNGIVSNMGSMHTNLKGITHSMQSLTKKMESFEVHLEHMDNITNHTGEMTNLLPRIQGAMGDITKKVETIDRDMALVGNGMTNIDQRFGHMTNGVILMRENIRQLSRTMGTLNAFMP